jgi:tetratricopeptide (TPR) repeat protein/GTPase SAR1 family protein
MFFDMVKEAEDDFPIPTFEPDSIFIGREHQIDLFEMYYTRWKKILFGTAPEDPLVTSEPSPDNKIQSLVVLLYGRGGFGKSTLLRRYQKMVLQDNQNPLCLGKTTVSKIIDWESAIRNKRSLFNPPEGQEIDAYEYYTIICRELAESLGKKPQDFREYQSVLKILGKTRKKASEVLDTMQKQDHYSWLRGLTVEFITSTIRSHIPGSNLVLDNPSVKVAVDEVAKLTQEQIEQISSTLYKRLGSDLSDYLEAPVRLGLAIGNDLSNFAKNSPLLIYFDTYEEIDEGDQLLRIIMGAAGIRVGWVIAGRDNLWAGTEQRRRTIDLEYSYKDIMLSDRGLAIDFNAGGVGAFTVSDIAEYFSQIRKNVQYEPPLPVVTKKHAADILDVTQGVPLAVNLAGMLYVETANLEIITKKSDGKRKIVDEMVQRYLRHTRSHQIERVKLYGLALLRRFDRPTTIAVAIGLNPEQAKTSYQVELSRLHRRYSFIFTGGNSPSLHQEIRHFLRLWLLENHNLPEIVTINEKLKESLLSELKKLEKYNAYKNLRSRLDDEEWVEVYLDLIQQTFWLNPTEGVRYALPFMLAASIYLREVNGNVAEIGKFFEAVIPQPYFKYWKWAAQSLIYKTSYNPSREELSGLEALEKLMHQQQFPCFPPYLLSKDYQEELEAMLWWRLGEVYATESDKKALEWFEKAHKQLAEDSELCQVISEITHHLGHESLDREDYLEAKSFFDHAIDLDPKAAHLYSDRGFAYLGLKRFQEAINDFNFSISLNPANSSLFYNRGQFYLRTEDYGKAIKDFNRAIDLEVGKASYYITRGNCYLKIKSYQNSIKDFNRAIKLKSNNGRYYMNRGNYYLEVKDYQNAINDFNKSIELEANNASHYIARGNYYLEVKDYQRAIDDFNVALDIDTTKAYCYLRRGRAFYELGDYQKSIIDYNRAIELDIELEHAGQKEKGITLLVLGKLEEAAKCFVKSLLIQPACSECWGDFTKVCNSSLYFPDSLNELVLTIPRLDINYASVLINRGEVMIAVRQYLLALEDFNRACQIEKCSIDITYNERGLILTYLKRYPEALELYQLDLEKNGSSISTLYNIAVAMARWKGVAVCQEHINVARRELLKAINSNDHIAALYGLGGLNALENKIEDALDYLRQAISCSDSVVLHWARHDMAWLDLRTDTRFQSLIGDQR